MSDQYFIDYDNLLDLAEDQYHIFYGNPEDIDYADFIASFADEDDAKDYVNWKNESDDGENDDGYEGDIDTYDEEPLDTLEDLDTRYN